MRSLRGGGGSGNPAGRGRAKRYLYFPREPLAAARTSPETSHCMRTQILAAYFGRERSGRKKEAPVTSFGGFSTGPERILAYK
ncbi:Hypothetical protein CINCED_3A018186, partial [Cinara cedri]